MKWKKKENVDLHGIKFLTERVHGCMAEKSLIEPRTQKCYTLYSNLPKRYTARPIPLFVKPINCGSVYIPFLISFFFFYSILIG